MSTTALEHSGATHSRTSAQPRVNELLDYIREGRILDAMREFYADGIVMQENNNPPTVGLAANLERERQFVESVRQWKSFDVGAVALDAERGKAIVQTAFEFDGVDGKTHRYDQVSVQTWRDGKIINEKFYYDTGAAAAGK